MTHKSGSATGDTLTLREQEILGRYRNSGLLRYRDFDAMYCVACERVYGVECPICKTVVGSRHMFNIYEETPFIVDRPLITDEQSGIRWTKVTCRKCDYSFKVPVH